MEFVGIFLAVYLALVLRDLTRDGIRRGIMAFFDAAVDWEAKRYLKRSGDTGWSGSQMWWWRQRVRLGFWGRK